MKTCFEYASVALFDLIVRSRERRGACDPKQEQDHEPAADEDQERGGGHDSVLHHVGVDQQHQQDQHTPSGNGGGDCKFNEGHESLLGTCEHANKAVYNQAASDEAQNEDEEGHGGSVRVVVEQNVDDHVQQHCNGDEDNGNGDEVGHGSGLGLLLDALGLAPLELRASLLARNACELLEVVGAINGDKPLPAPVVHGLLGDAQCL